MYSGQSSVSRMVVALDVAITVAATLPFLEVGRERETIGGREPASQSAVIVMEVSWPTTVFFFANSCRETASET